MNSFVERLVDDILAEAAPNMTRPAAEFLAAGFSALVNAFKRSLVTPMMVDYACKVARGVLANKTLPVELQLDLVVDGIRILMDNPSIEWGPDEKMSVHALATVALLQAGYVGPPIPAHE